MSALTQLDQTEIRHLWFDYCVERYCHYEGQDSVKALFWWSLRYVHRFGPGEWWLYWRYKVESEQNMLKWFKTVKRAQKKKKRRR